MQNFKTLFRQKLSQRHDMKFLVIGCGSIGRRHAKNLKSLGHEVLVCDLAEENRKWAAKELGAKTFADAASAYGEKPNGAFVCTPNHTHLPSATAALEAGCHVFIEKPISHTLDGIDALAALASKMNRQVQIGFNMRFTPGMRKLKEVLLSEKYGKALSARVIVSQYLPYWRPDSDYRKSYTGKKSMGGGIILEATHELDYLCWLLGKPTQIACFARKVSSLEVDTEDTAEIMIDFAGGSVAGIHMDFVRQDYCRGCEIICEKGTLVWQFEWKGKKNRLEARTFDVKGQKIVSEFLCDEPFEANDMYLNEAREFADAVSGKRKASPTIADGKLALQMGLASLESSEKGKAIKL